MSVWGALLRVSTFGESHGKAVGCVLDGLPAGLTVDRDLVQAALRRRRPGQSNLTTARQEADEVEILSGINDDQVTLGSPIAMLVRNHDQRKYDYANTAETPRPGHADYTYMVKFGLNAASGGGRASARETIGRVAAGAVVEAWLLQWYGTSIHCWVSSVADITIPSDVAAQLERTPPTRELVDKQGELIEIPGVGFVSAVGNSDTDGPRVSTRCPHPGTAVRIATRIQEIRRMEDSIGGVLTCVIRGCPAGLGEPCFDKLQAALAHAMMSLPAARGFELGAGFAGVASRTGSQQNDCFRAADPGGGAAAMRGPGVPAPGVHAVPLAGSGQLRLLGTLSNNSAGMLGGISTGEDIIFRVAIKPVSSIAQPQQTAKYDGHPSTLTVKGRHDPCVLPRAPPLVEAMTALVIGDLALRQRSRSAGELATVPEKLLVANRSE